MTTTDRAPITPAPDGEAAATTHTPEELAAIYARWDLFCAAMAELGRELREEAAALEAEAA